MASTNLGCVVSSTPRYCLKTVVGRSSPCSTARNAPNLFSKPSSPATLLSRRMCRSPVPASPHRSVEGLASLVRLSRSLCVHTMGCRWICRRAPLNRPSPVMSCSSAQAKPISGQGQPDRAHAFRSLLIPAVAVAILGRVIDGKGAQQKQQSDDVRDWCTSDDV